MLIHSFIYSLHRYLLSTCEIGVGWLLVIQRQISHGFWSQRAYVLVEEIMIRKKKISMWNDIRYENSGKFGSMIFHSYKCIFYTAESQQLEYT